MNCTRALVYFGWYITVDRPLNSRLPFGLLTKRPTRQAASLIQAQCSFVPNEFSKENTIERLAYSFLGSTSYHYLVCCLMFSFFHNREKVNSGNPLS